MPELILNGQSLGSQILRNLLKSSKCWGSLVLRNPCYCCLLLDGWRGGDGNPSLVEVTWWNDYILGLLFGKGWGHPVESQTTNLPLKTKKNGKKSRSPCNPKKNGPVAPIPPSCWLSWSSPWCPALWPAGSDPEVGRYPAGGLSPNFTDPFEEHYCQEYSKVSFKSQMVEKPRFVECRTGPIKEIPSLPLESPLIYYINLAKKTLQTRWDRVYEMHRASIQPWGEVIWTRKTFHKYQLYPLNLLLDSNWINTKYTTNILLDHTGSPPST